MPEVIITSTSGTPEEQVECQTTLIIRVSGENFVRMVVLCLMRAHDTSSHGRYRGKEREHREAKIEDEDATFADNLLVVETWPA